MIGGVVVRTMVGAGTQGRAGQGRPGRVAAVDVQMLIGPCELGFR